MPQNRNQSPLILITATLALAAVCLAAEVGSEAPNGLAGRFVNAFYRNGFAYLVSLPPVNNVRSFGSGGLIQEFNSIGAAGGGAGGVAGPRLALVKANQSTAFPTDGSPDVAQVLANMYAYYGAIANTAGFPTTDTLTCPKVTTIGCQYQFFNKNYVLFAYDSQTFNGDNFAVRDPFYTKWVSLGGVDRIGPATDIERNVTTLSGAATATAQAYANGAIYNNTAGTLSGRILAVVQPIYAAYLRAGGHDGYLGLPTSEDIALAGGGRRQSFQGGNLDYTVGTDPVLKLPVDSISILPYATTPFQLKQGDTLPLRAFLFTSNSAALTDRLVAWVSTNSRVIAIDAAAGSNNATARAVGAGTALITAISEGKTSPSITISVTAVCCQIGEGAPTPAIQQAIRDAVTRNRLSIAVPTKSTAQRIGTGYTQELFSTGTPAIRYLVTKSDRSPTAYVVTGDVLLRYNLLGGPAGSLGYPASDGDPAGYQLFENSYALASSPPRLVTGAILAKWRTLSFASGLAGLPLGEAVPVVASTGTQAQQQTFAKGVIFAATSGPRSGQAQLVSGLILDRYVAIGGLRGDLGLPTGDEFGLDGRRRQDFEGGYIDYAPGDRAAVEHGAARRPAISSNPAGTVVAGSRLRLAVTGFADGSSLRVSITDQADFVVAAENGSYIWETFIPLTAPGKTFIVRAVDASGASADGSYTVKALTESRLRLAKTHGDAQVGAPGAQLAERLRVQLQDESGTPVIGVPVTFAASPGGQILSATGVTDDTGQAEAVVRLPLGEGLALFTAESSRSVTSVTTFSARAGAVSLSNFPTFLQNAAPYGSQALGKGTATIAQKGALLTSVAGILRYYQGRGDLTGAVDPGSLNQALQGLCTVDTQVCDGFLTNPDGGEQVVNLWRAGTAVGGRVDVIVETPDATAARDIVSRDEPALLALALTANGAPAGGHYVVAVGVAADGNVLIRDPNPDFGRTSLNEYLSGFQAAGLTWKATIGAVVRLMPRAPSTSGFLLAAISQSAATLDTLTMDAASVAGPCGRSITLADAATIPPASAAPLVSRIHYCDGSQPLYQLSIGGPQLYRAAVYDLANGGRRTELGSSGVVAFRATRPAGQIALAPQDVTLTSNGIVNAATFTEGIAPGGLMAVFGSGLSGPGADSTSVEVNGVVARLVSKSPFQLNAQVPPDLAPGRYPVRVRSPFGSADLTAEVRTAAPAIFLISGSLAAGRGVVVNQDGPLNAPATPNRRGQVLTIYCTGLGAVSASGALFTTQAPVTAILNGQEIRPAFSGLTPGFIGLYQVNLPVPVATPPGINLPLVLRQTNIDSNTVFVAIQ